MKMKCVRVLVAACIAMPASAALAHQSVQVAIDGQELSLPFVDGHVLFDGDISLQPHQYDLVTTTRAATRGTPRVVINDVDDVINLNVKLWQQSDLTFDYDQDLPEESVRHVLAATSDWSRQTDFTLRPVWPGEQVMIRFRKTDQGCRAPLGAPETLPAVVDLAATCDLQSVLHEIGHVLGMQHEHQRTDRGEHLTMRRDSLAWIRDHIGASKHEAVMYNLARENPGYEADIPFDLTSVMMFGSYPRNDPTLFHELYSRSFPLFTDRQGRLIPRPTLGITGKDVLLANHLVALQGQR